VRAAYNDKEADRLNMAQLPTSESRFGLPVRRDHSWLLTGEDLRAFEGDWVDTDSRSKVNWPFSGWSDPASTRIASNARVFRQSQNRADHVWTGKPNRLL